MNLFLESLGSQNFRLPAEAHELPNTDVSGKEGETSQPCLTARPLEFRASQRRTPGIPTFEGLLGPGSIAANQENPTNRKLWQKNTRSDHFVHLITLKSSKPGR